MKQSLTSLNQGAAAPRPCCGPGGRASVKPSAASAGRGQTIPGIDPNIKVDLAQPITHADQGSLDDMVRMEGGTFLMGTDSDERWESDGEGPVRPVSVPGFYIDRHAVTNQAFARFVEATGHRTDAEVFGWSFVFHTLLAPKYAARLRTTHAVQGLAWWLAVPGASWRHPEGEKSSIRHRMDHPVVQVSWNDAVAYCRWAGKRLPTEAQWEYAARGGRVQTIYPWGDELVDRGRFFCNTWQGRFPEKDTGEDGFVGTCPVDAFRPNDWGLFNVCGNVWEWCHDWFDPAWHTDDQGHVRPQCQDNPLGPDNGQVKMQKGGSFLCHVSYCNRYRLAARTGNTPDSASSNSGFRCVRDL